MRKVEEHVFHAEDKDVVAFMKSYTSSFNMIGVAVVLPVFVDVGVLRHYREPLLPKLL